MRRSSLPLLESGPGGAPWGLEWGPAHFGGRLGVSLLLNSLEPASGITHYHRGIFKQLALGPPPLCPLPTAL